MPVSRKAHRKPKRLRQYSFLTDYTDATGTWMHRVMRAYRARSLEQAIAGVRALSRQEGNTIQAAWWLRGNAMPFEELMANMDHLPDVDVRLVYFTNLAVDEMKRDIEWCRQMTCGLGGTRGVRH